MPKLTWLIQQNTACGAIRRVCNGVATANPTMDVLTLTLVQWPWHYKSIALESIWLAWHWPRKYGWPACFEGGVVVGFPFQHVFDWLHHFVFIVNCLQCGCVRPPTISSTITRLRCSCAPRVCARCCTCYISICNIWHVVSSMESVMGSQRNACPTIDSGATAMALQLHCIGINLVSFALATIVRMAGLLGGWCCQVSFSA